MNKSKSQKDIFSSYESDNWFLRNKEQMKSKKEFLDVNEILRYIKKGDSVLEIGCSNGTKLNYIDENLPENDLKLYGIDPSKKSIEDGNKNFKKINFEVGTSDILNYADNTFDIVIVGFCLYVVDRSLIFKTISEIDRVLKSTGFLVITDFEPPAPLKKIYHHTEGIYSYKNTYSSFFTGGGHYSLIRKTLFSHSDYSTFDSEIDERVSTSVLYKEDMDDVYRLLT